MHYKQEQCVSLFPRPGNHMSAMFFLFRPKKNICVFTVTCQKNLGSVGRH